MRCEDVRERLDDYVDGVLPEDASAQLKEHLSSCEGCRRDADDLRAVLRDAAALPTDILPERDLWPGIEAGLSTPLAAVSGRPRRVWHAGGILAAAAAILLVAAALLLHRAPSGMGLPGPAAQPEALGDLTAEAQRAEAAYAQARQELLAGLAERKDALDPETRRVIEENLAVVDDAIEEIRAALAQDPRNAQLLRMLVAMHDRNLTLIGIAARLSSDT